MARARNIKPGLFKNEILGVADPIYTLVFQGLWVLADREGRLEDRPLRIKAEVLPYRDGIDMNSILDWLQANGFIVRYAAECMRYIMITNFAKHQNPHKNESESEIPAPVLVPKVSEIIGTCSEIKESARADSLIPDSLNLIPDSGLPSVSQPEFPAAPKNPAGDDETALQAACRETWQSYCSAFSDRYGIDPVRNKTVNAQVKQFVQRLGREESPAVAAFYVRHPQAFYVKSKHQFGLALKDAEGLRTEWATNRIVTDAQARQSDRTGSNLSAADEAMRILEGEVMQ